MGFGSLDICCDTGSDTGTNPDGGATSQDSSSASEEESFLPTPLYSMPNEICLRCIQR